MKKNFLIYIIATVCGIGWMLSGWIEPLIPFLECTTWIYLLLTYLSVIDILVERDDSRKFVFIYCVQMVVYILTFICRPSLGDNLYVGKIATVIIGILIIVELYLRTKFLKTDYNENEKRASVSEKMVTNYFFDTMLYVFKMRKNKSDIGKKNETAIKVIVLNILAFLIMGAIFVLKFILDIVYIYEETYVVPRIILGVYICLNIIFLIIFFIKGKLLSYSPIKSVLINVSTLISNYVFVFETYESMNLVALLVCLYFIGPFLIDTWRIGRKYCIEEN